MRSRVYNSTGKRSGGSFAVTKKTPAEGKKKREITDGGWGMDKADFLKHIISDFSGRTISREMLSDVHFAK